MSIQSVSRIFFATAILAAVMLIANFAHAKTSAIDSALNNSLEESRELNKELEHTFAQSKSTADHKTKVRQAVEINMDEADAKNAAIYKDIQANGDLKESSY